MTRDGYGIDMADPEVLALIQRLYYRRLAWAVEQVGLDPEDVLQQIYLGVLARNAGESPYDPSRSRQSTYLYVVCRSVTANAVDARRRAIRRGWVVGDHEDLAIRADVGQWAKRGDS